MLLAINPYFLVALAAERDEAVVLLIKVSVASSPVLFPVQSIAVPTSVQ